MTTEQGNKLIAEFMGVNIGEAYDLFGPDNYDLNWSALMPVVEKISTIHYGWENKEDEYDDCAYPRTFGMRDKDGNYMVRINAQPVFSDPKLIEAAWQAVVWFIENNKTHKP